MRSLEEWSGQEEYTIGGVTVVDPESRESFPGYVRIERGKIVDVGKGGSSSQDEFFDGGGLYLSPGFIDIHVHLREPGFEHKETIHTGSIAAVAGGFTSVACMPNTEPPIDDKSVVEYVLRKARLARLAKVYPVGAATMGRRGEKLSEYGRLASAGIVAVSDDGLPIADAQMVRRVLEYAGRFGLPVIEHCEDLSMSGNGVMHEGLYSTKLGLGGIPAYSEQICLARDLIVLNSVRSKLHVAHVSTRGSVELLREAKNRGLPVTAETAPHYISLEDKEVESFDTSFKTNPPLRSAQDRESLIEALKEGTIDCIATDHAPHAPEEKEVEFDHAPPGAIGLETAFSVINTYLVKPGHIDLISALGLITIKPASILSLPGGTLRRGGAADLCLFDPEEKWHVSVEDFHSKSTNSPYIGRTLYGRVKYSIIDGRVVQVEKLGKAVL